VLLPGRPERPSEPLDKPLVPAGDTRAPPEAKGHSRVHLHISTVSDDGQHYYRTCKSASRDFWKWADHLWQITAQIGVDLLL